MASNLFDLTGKTAVVIGGTSGIGLAMALGLADAGADVVAKLKAVPQVDDVEVELPSDGDWTHAKIFAEPGVDVREEIYGVVRQNNWPLRELSRVKATLEEAFVELTQD